MIRRHAVPARRLLIGSLVDIVCICGIIELLGHVSQKCHGVDARNASISNKMHNPLYRSV